MTEGIEGIGMTFDFGHANTMGKVNDFLPLLTGQTTSISMTTMACPMNTLPSGQGPSTGRRWEKTIAADYSGDRGYRRPVDRGGKDESCRCSGGILREMSRRAISEHLQGKSPEVIFV